MKEEKLPMEFVCQASIAAVNMKIATLKVENVAMDTVAITNILKLWQICPVSMT
jgi:hypothetical protein